jgi:hypothetical protein
MKALVALALGLGAWHLPAAGNFPPTEAFVRQVRLALTEGHRAHEDFVYLEDRRKVDISLFGKVTLGPMRTFEVYPSPEPGGTYKRLIRIDGRPLDPDELARRDSEHARNRQRAAERAARESRRQREARKEEAAEARRKTEAIFDDAVAVFEPVFAGRDLVDGEPVLVVDLRPREGAEVRTREGDWMRHFRGRVWVAESSHQIVRLDMHAFRDLTIGWGVVGRLDEGSRVRYSQRRVDGVWLPEELSYEASGRTLLVRPFEIAAATRWYDYRRQNAAARRHTPVPGS